MIAATLGVDLRCAAKFAGNDEQNLVVQAALDGLADRVDAIYADFDIDVIDRAQCPGAPGARPGGMAVHDFFAAARMIAAHPKVRAVDLTEFDPGLDVGQISALTAGRWVCEILAGLAGRQLPPNRSSSRSI